MAGRRETPSICTFSPLAMNTWCLLLLGLGAVVWAQDEAHKAVTVVQQANVTQDLNMTKTAFMGSSYRPHGYKPPSKGHKRGRAESCEDSGGSVSCSVEDHFKAKKVHTKFQLEVPMAIKSEVVPLAAFVENTVRDVSDCISASDGSGGCDESSTSEENSAGCKNCEIKRARKQQQHGGLHATRVVPVLHHRPPPVKPTTGHHHALAKPPGRNIPA